MRGANKRTRHAFALSRRDIGIRCERGRNGQRGQVSNALMLGKGVDGACLPGMVMLLEGELSFVRTRQSGREGKEPREHKSHPWVCGPHAATLLTERREVKRYRMAWRHCVRERRPLASPPPRGGPP